MFSFEKILSDDSLKEYRADLKHAVRTYFNKDLGGGNPSKLKKYVKTPILSPILQITDHTLFELKNWHLEYFPMVNPRFFSIGKDEGKDIKNVEFRETYIRFIRMFLHQRVDKENQINFIERQKLQFSLYL